MSNSKSTYDFYENPPKTRDQIREYVTTWLEPTNDPTVYTISGETFVNEQGFRRAFNLHSVFRNVQTGEYAWHVSEAGDFSNFSSTRYLSMEELVEGVVEEFYVLWKLGDSE